MTRYEPANSFETPRFSGVRTFMRLPNKPCFIEEIYEIVKSRPTTHQGARAAG